VQSAKKCRTDVRETYSVVGSATNEIADNTRRANDYE